MSENVVDSTPSGSDISAPAQPAATPQAPAAQPATPAAAAPASGAPPQEGWVPSYRLREAREAAAREAQQTYAQQMQQIRAEAEQYKRQLYSLVGVQPPQNPEIAAVRSQFSQLYPGLARMEENAARLEELLERSGNLEQQNEHYWKSYGRQTVDRLFDEAGKSMGSPLSDEGKRMLHTSFLGWVSSSPELTERYANDPTIVQDFLKGFGSSFFDPIRRTATASIPGRANVALPQDSPSGAPRVPGPPQPKDLDERVAQGWAMLQSRGGQSQ